MAGWTLSPGDWCHLDGASGEPTSSDFGGFAHFRDPDGNLIGLWHDCRRRFVFVGPDG